MRKTGKCKYCNCAKDVLLVFGACSGCQDQVPEEDKIAAVAELMEDFEPKVKVKKPIPKESKKRAKQNRQYRKDRIPFLEERPTCEIKYEGCTIKSTEVHHTDGREEDQLNNFEDCMASCGSCHRTVHRNPGKARKDGFLKSNREVKKHQYLKRA